MRRAIVLCAALQVGFWACGEVRGQAHFLRGDSNLDMKIDLSDGVFTLGFLFLGGPAPPCRDGADVNDSGVVDIADPVYTFNWLFIGGPTPAAPYPNFEADPTADGLGCLEFVDVSGEITADTTWVRTKVYRLLSGVFVREPATLTIQEGTTVIGDSATDGLLIVDRGAKIVAVGSPTHPVVFTSDKPVGERKRGDWGGLILLGRGDLNVPGKESLAEGLPNSLYGGGANVIPDDSSGRLSYVRIEFGGTQISPDNEVNALSLFGCGSNTQLDHIQFKKNDDDGCEWFGGAASLRYGLVTFVSDDMFDYSFGWQGKGQFWVGLEQPDASDCGFEVDNSEAAGSFANEPRTCPTISNVTLAGVGDPTSTGGGQGILIRRGAGTKLYNFIVTGFKKPGLDIDDATTCDNVGTGCLLVDYGVFYQNGADGVSHWQTGETGSQDETTFACTSEGIAKSAHNVLATVSPVVDPFNLTNPDFTPQNDALVDPFDPTTLDSFFEPAPYRGAVPSTGSNWTKDRWISYLLE